MTKGSSAKDETDTGQNGRERLLKQPSEGAPGVRRPSEAEGKSADSSGRSGAAENPVKAVASLSWVALMAALVAAGAFIHVNIGPVPVTFQDFFVALAGLVLGPRKGMMAVLLYIAAGCVGLPVFSGGRAGIVHLAGPTGGYLAGFVLMAAIAGAGGRVVMRRASGKPGQNTGGYVESLLAALFCLGGLLVVYAFGAAGLVCLMDFTPARAVAVGVVPFLPVGPFKMLAAAMVWQRLKRRSLGPKGF